MCHIFTCLNLARTCTYLIRTVARCTPAMKRDLSQHGLNESTVCEELNTIRFHKLFVHCVLLPPASCTDLMSLIDLKGILVYKQYKLFMHYEMLLCLPLILRAEIWAELGVEENIPSRDLNYELKLWGKGATVQAKKSKSVSVIQVKNIMTHCNAFMCNKQISLLDSWEAVHQTFEIRYNFWINSVLMHTLSLCLVFCTQGSVEPMQIDADPQEDQQNAPDTNYVVENPTLVRVEFTSRKSNHREKGV